MLNRYYEGVEIGSTASYGPVTVTEGQLLGFASGSSTLGCTW